MTDGRLCLCGELHKQQCQQSLPLDVDALACNRNDVYLLSGGSCYISDMTLSHCQPIDVSTQQSVTDSAADTHLMRDGPVQKQQFVSIATNDWSTFAVTTERNLMSIRRQGLSCHVERLLNGFKVSSVSCGKCHTLVLSAIGVVFSCGLGNQGQLGHGSLDSEHSLRVIEALEGVQMTSVCAGGWHSMAVSDSSDLYVWGWNNIGQLGLRSDAITRTSRHLDSAGHDSRDEVRVN